MAKNFVKAIEIQIMDSAGLDHNFTPFDEDGLPEACFLIRFVNDSNIDVLISYDGQTAQDILFQDVTLDLNFQQNSSPQGYSCLMRKGSLISLASVTGAGGNGNIYLVGYYQEA